MLLLLAVAAACGGDDGGDDISPDAATGDPNLKVGVFAVDLVAANAEVDPPTAAYTSVVGTVYDAEQPVGVLWDTAMTAGDCTLLIPRIPFCETPCGADAVCVDDGVCQPYATKQGVGDVTVTGIGPAAFTMKAIANSYQPPAGTVLPYPPFAAGDAIRFSAAGSSWNGAFVLDGTAFDPLAISSPDATLERGTAVALAWTAPAGSGAGVLVELDISHHGGTRGKIECTSSDDGALSLDGALITGLLDLGVSGYPTVKVIRTATTSTVIGAGRVDLELRSEVQRPVVIPGVVSCHEDDECPEPQTCDDDLRCR